MQQNQQQFPGDMIQNNQNDGFNNNTAGMQQNNFSNTMQQQNNFDQPQNSGMTQNQGNYGSLS